MILGTLSFLLYRYFGPVTLVRQKRTLRPTAVPGSTVLPRDSIARYMLWPCVCPSVRLSVTSRCSTTTAKRRITQTTPHNSSGNLVFGRQRYPRNSIGITPCGGAKRRWGGSKSATFDNSWLYLENGTR